MDDKIIGIEVAGLTYGLKDEETANTADQAKTKANTAAEAAEAASSAVEEQAQKVAQIESNIGETNIQELDATVESHSEELAEVAEELPKINATLSEMPFSKMVLLKEGENDNFIGFNSEQENVTFNIPGWDKYKGVVLVHSYFFMAIGGDYREQSSVRRMETFLKKEDGSLLAWLFSVTHGDRMVNSEHKFTVDPLGRATLKQGYSPKEDSDSESDEGQQVIPIYKIYGIL